MLHYLILVVEYCLLPFVLFVLVFSSKIKWNTASQNEESINDLIGDGYELILIEAFAYIPLSLRFFSFEDTPKDALVNYWVPGASILLFISLIVFSRFVYMKEQGAIVKSVRGFRLTFYGSYFSWWFRLVLIGLTIHEWTASANAITLFIGAVVSLCLLFYFVFFQKIISQHFLNPGVLIREITGKLNSHLYVDAQKKTWKLLEYLKDKSGQDNYRCLVDAIFCLGNAYALHADKDSKRFDQAISEIDSFLNKQTNEDYDKNELKNTLAALYCIRDKEDDRELAKGLISEAYNDNEIIRDEKLELIKNKRCKKLVEISFD